VALAAGVASGSWAQARGALLAGLHKLAREGPGDAAQALNELDTNRDGHVEFDEVAAFAKNKGLDYAATVQEFSGFDADHDGRLDVVELAGALGLPPPGPKTAGTLKVARASDPAATVPAAPGAAASALAAVPKQSFALRSATFSTLATQLELEVAKEQEAQALERKAADVRVTLAALGAQATQRAMDAARRAAEATAEALSTNVTQLDAEATRAEVRAAALRAKVEADLRRVTGLSEVARLGLAAVGGGSR